MNVGGISLPETKSSIGLSNVTNDAQLPLAGGTMTGDIAMGGHNVSGAGTITANQVNTSGIASGGGDCTFNYAQNGAFRIRGQGGLIVDANSTFQSNVTFNSKLTMGSLANGIEVGGTSITNFGTVIFDGTSAFIGSLELSGGNLTADYHTVIDGSGQLYYIGTGTYIVDGSGNFYLRSHPPASSTAPGTTGQFTYDADFLYIAVGTNSWRRAALSTF